MVVSNDSPAEPEFPATTMHVRRAMAGDPESLNWIVSRLTPLLVVQAEFRLGPAMHKEVDAEDLVHEAWAAVLPKLGELTPRDGRVTPVLLKYLSTTMTYRINAILRKRLVGAPGGSGARDPEVVGQLPASTSGVLTRVVRREVQDSIRDHLEQLAEPDREILVLRGIEQHPAKTVAVMLEIEPSAVDKRYSRAMQRLRERFPESVFAEF